MGVVVMKTQDSILNKYPRRVLCQASLSNYNGSWMVGKESTDVSKSL